MDQECQGCNRAIQHSTERRESENNCASECVCVCVRACVCACVCQAKQNSVMATAECQQRCETNFQPTHANKPDLRTLKHTPKHTHTTTTHETAHAQYCQPTFHDCAKHQDVLLVKNNRCGHTCPAAPPLKNRCTPTARSCMRPCVCS